MADATFVLMEHDDWPDRFLFVRFTHDGQVVDVLTPDGNWESYTENLVTLMSHTGWLPRWDPECLEEDDDADS